MAVIIGQVFDMMNSKWRGQIEEGSPGFQSFLQIESSNR